MIIKNDVINIVVVSKIFRLFFYIYIIVLIYTNLRCLNLDILRYKRSITGRAISINYVDLNRDFYYKV